MVKKANTKKVRKENMLWWRNHADLDQIIQEKEDLIIKGCAEINQAQLVQWK